MAEFLQIKRPLQHGHKGCECGCFFVNNILDWQLGVNYRDPWTSNPKSAGEAQCRRLFLHEKRGLEVRNFLTFPNSL